MAKVRIGTFGVSWGRSGALRGIAEAGACGRVRWGDGVEVEIRGRRRVSGSFSGFQGHLREGLGSVCRVLCGWANSMRIWLSAAFLLMRCTFLPDVVDTDGIMAGT